MKYIKSFVVLVTLLLLGATGINAQVSNGDIIITATGGTMSASVGSLSGGNYRVTLTATPNPGYTILAKDILVYPLVDPSAASRRRAPGLAEALPVYDGASDNEFYFDLPDRYHGAMVTATFAPPVTPGNYVLHSSTKGYLSVKGANVTLVTNSTLQYEDIYNNEKGNAFWVLTSEGYLQNNVYYLNVANNQTLYLSVKPVTRWQQEKILDNEHGKTHIKYNNLYLCNDGNKITLKPTLAETDSYYNACPITITENNKDNKGWTGPTKGDLTVQSPQLVTYLRYYFTQQIDYEFYDDDNTKKSETCKSRFVYAKLEYDSEGADKGTKWNISDGIIYNLGTSNVTVNAKYNLKPADSEVFKNHSEATQVNIKLTIQPKTLVPVNGMDYLLFNIKGPDTHRFPNDNNSQSENDLLIPNGLGGTGTSSILTDPLDNQGSGRNQEISWKVTVDTEGFYSFQNTKTNRFLYYDETGHASSDYGVIRVGATTLPTDESAAKYKFRLLKTNASSYSLCYFIIPYSKQFAVYKSDGVASDIYAILNSYDYREKSTPIVGLSNSNDNSKWCIYKYEAEYRIKTDFSIKVETTNIADATGDYKFYSESCWYGKCIKESPKDGSAQRDLVISGTYKDASRIDYLWTVTGLGSSIGISDGTLTDGTWTKTTTGNTENRKLVINVPSMPASTISGVIQLKLSGGEAPNVVTTSNNNAKTVAFTILGNGAVTFTDIYSLAQIELSNGAYRLIDGENSDFAYSSTNKPGTTSFTGILEGNGVTISDLTAPLFETMTNGTVRNVNLTGVSITHAGPTGAIAGTADGGSRIYNVGILDGEVSSSDGYCGGIVGKLDGSARVINCFSYANITGGTTVAGIVGYNNYKSTMTDLRTMVVNCMFYGDITGGTTKYPVYGGQKINNADASGINNYNYFLETATFDDSYTSIDNYNCSWPVGERYLTRYEIYRNILNSNRRLCTWWVRGVNNTAPTDADVESVGIAKWVLDPAIAPYPILKTWGKYPSVVNPDPDQRVDPTTKEWTNRSSSNKWGTNDAPDTEGQILESVTVTIKGGSNNSSASDSRTINITAMDTEYKDYCYGKIQLPYYNEIFGNPEGATWAAKYGNNYTSKVVTGWKITKVNGSTSGSGPDFVEHWESGYNFADRTSTKKDLFDISGRVFAQGGFYYVPDGVTSIEIEAYWGDAVYLCNNGRNLDRMNIGANEFTVSGTLPEKVGGESTNPAVKTSLKDAVTALTAQANKTVYDQAVVLVGNYQDNAFQGGITLKGSEYSTKAKPFTIMSADFDFDNEPDFCFQGGMSGGGRINSQPIRFDFVMVPDITMAIRTNANYYGMRIFCPQGHFEITETSYMYCTQFEYEERNADDYKKTEAPMILNGGEFMQIVSSEAYTVTANNATATDRVDKTSYFLMGGHVYMYAFSPGCHGNKNIGTRHCAVNAIGGEYSEFYLSGMFNANFYNMTDNPHAYLDGGKFGMVAGAGMESVGQENETNGGDVTFKINHSLIDEFYGGGINAQRPVTGNISVTIDNSKVKKYCGGPKLGDMSNTKTITTNATGTTFDEYYGGGNGGTNLLRDRKSDSGAGVAAPTKDDHTLWDRESTGNGQENKYGGFFTAFTPFEYDAAKGYQAEYEFEMLPRTSGDSRVITRSYYYWASFSKTTVAPVTNTITDCTFNGNFYGGGNLGAVDSPTSSTDPAISSTLSGHTVVHGSAFGAGYSASATSFKVHDKSTVVYPYRDNAGFIHDGSLDYDPTEYTWIHTIPTDWNKTASTSSPTFDYKGKYYCYTDVDLTGLGTVKGDVSLTIEGTTEIDEDVYGGGDASAVDGNTTVILQGMATITGNVFGGGNSGDVTGSASVTIRETPTSGSGSGSSTGGESGGNESGGGSGD